MSEPWGEGLVAFTTTVPKPPQFTLVFPGGWSWTVVMKAPSAFRRFLWWVVLGGAWRRDA